jgi:hypothetical protein
MSKRAKQLTKRERRLTASQDEAAGRVYTFDEVPPMRFAGTIEDYLDLVAQRLKAESEPGDPPEWDEHDAQLIEALREEYQAGRLAFYRSSEGLVCGLEVAPVVTVSLQRPIRSIPSTPDDVGAAA